MERASHTISEIIQATYEITKFGTKEYNQNMSKCSREKMSSCREFSRDAGPTYAVTAAFKI